MSDSGAAPVQVGLDPAGAAFARMASSVGFLPRDELARPRREFLASESGRLGTPVEDAAARPADAAARQAVRSPHSPGPSWC